MHAATNDRERRENRRALVQWEAECALGPCVVHGRFRDVTDTGAFLETDPELTEILSNAVATNTIAEGDEVVVTYLISPDWQAERTIASVRWLGHSAKHHCTGLGLEFETH